jgi:chromate transport protein ChrA
MAYLANRSVRALKGGVAILIVMMVAIALALLVNAAVPTENREMVSLIVGALITNLTNVVANLFPTSAGRSRSADP